jgi:hypothetical protein
MEREYQGIGKYLERAIVMTEGDTITTEYFPQELLQLQSQIIVNIPESWIPLKEVLKEITRMARKSNTRALNVRRTTVPGGPTVRDQPSSLNV